MLNSDVRLTGQSPLKNYWNRPAELEKLSLFLTHTKR